MTFASREAASFWRYISSSLDRLVAVAAGMDSGGLHWTPPAPETNSIAVLVIHTLGNAEENILETLCGERVDRNRAGEFRQPDVTAADLQHRWQDLRPRLESALFALTDEDLGSDRPHPRRGTIPGREILIVVARHSAEHLGQAELTRDLWLASRRSV